MEVLRKMEQMNCGHKLYCSGGGARLNIAKSSPVWKDTERREGENDCQMKRAKKMG